MAGRKAILDGRYAPIPRWLLAAVRAAGGRPAPAADTGSVLAVARRLACQAAGRRRTGQGAGCRSGRKGMDGGSGGAIATAIVSTVYVCRLRCGLAGEASQTFPIRRPVQNPDLARFDAKAVPHRVESRNAGPAPPAPLDHQNVSAAKAICQSRDSGKACIGGNLRLSKKF